jgi:hypothetical protein
MRDLPREDDGSRLGILLDLPPHVSHLGERMSSVEEMKASVVLCATFDWEHQPSIRAATRTDLWFSAGPTNGAALALGWCSAHRSFARMADPYPDNRL